MIAGITLCFILNKIHISNLFHYKTVYDSLRQHQFDGEQASTLFNTNRELHHAAQSLLDVLELNIELAKPTGQGLASL